MAPRWISLAALAAAAIGGALSGVHPTGTAVVDPALGALLAAGIAFVAGRAHPAALVVGATAVAATGSPLAQVLAVVAATLTIVRPAGAPAPLAGAALAVGLLHLAWPEPFGATAAVALAVALLLLVAATPRLRTRRVAGLVLGVAGIGLAASAGLALTLARDARDLRRAVDLADTALSAARRGDAVEAATAFTTANDLVDGTATALDRWWVRTALAVPVVAQHSRAVEELAETALELTDVGAEAAIAAHPSRLAVRDGRIDLAAVTALGRPLRELGDLLDGLDRRLHGVRSSWLVGPLVDQVDELVDRAEDERDDVATAVAATDAAPWLLGEGVERRYFLAVMNPAELRGGGGFVGNWGVLTVTDGRFALPRFGRIAELYRDEPYEIDVNPEWNARYVDGWGVDEYPQAALGSPHFPDNATAFRQIAEQAGLGPIDGVIALDPIAMAGFLTLTGPLEVDGWPEPLTSANAAEALLHRQYLDAEGAARVELLERTTNALFDRLTTQALPQPATIADALGPVVASGHLQLAAFDRASAAFLHGVGLERRLEPPVDDSLAVITASAIGSKLDWFLQRTVAYDLRTEPDGQLSATLEVRLQNDAPDTIDNGYFGDPPGRNRQLVSIYTPFPNASATLDGEHVDLGVSSERGHHVYDVFLEIPPGGSATLRVELGGRRRTPGQPFDLVVSQQPTAHPDQYRITADGREVFSGTLTSPRHLTIR